MSSLVWQITSKCENLFNILKEKCQFFVMNLSEGLNSDQVQEFWNKDSIIKSFVLIVFFICIEHVWKNVWEYSQLINRVFLFQPMESFEKVLVLVSWKGYVRGPITAVWIMWDTPRFLLTAAFFHRKVANFAISENRDIDCILVHNF